MGYARGKLAQCCPGPVALAGLAVLRGPLRGKQRCRRGCRRPADLSPQELLQKAELPLSSLTDAVAGKVSRGRA